MFFQRICLFHYSQFIYPLPFAITASFSSPGWWFMMRDPVDSQDPKSRPIPSESSLLPSETASLTGTDLSQFSGLNVFLHPALESGWNFFWIGTFKERWCVAGRWTASFQQTFPQTHTYALVDIGLTQGLTHPSFLPSNYRKCIQPIRVEALIQ